MYVLGKSTIFPEIIQTSERTEVLDGTGAGEGNRTLVVSLGSFCSAIELHPRSPRRLKIRGAPDAFKSRRGEACLGRVGGGLVGEGERGGAARSHARHRPDAPGCARRRSRTLHLRKELQ